MPALYFLGLAIFFIGVTVGLTIMYFVDRSVFEDMCRYVKEADDYAEITRANLESALNELNDLKREKEHSHNAFVESDDTWND